MKIINKVRSMFEGSGGDLDVHKILVTGFPHSGTSIMRAILGNIDCVYSHPWEANMVTEKMAKKAKSEGASRVVVKWPFTSSDFLDEEHSVFKEYKKIFIIRSPYYTYSSLNQSGTANEPNTRIEDWQRASQYWIALDGSERKDVLCIKYEQLFEKDFTGMRRVIDFLGVKDYDESVFRENQEYEHQFENLSGEVETCPRTPQEHAKYRLWQIQQPFRCSNGPGRLNLSKAQIQQISSMVETAVLGYNEEVLCHLLNPTK